MAERQKFDDEFQRRFWGRVAVARIGCWHWTAGQDRSGYGAISYRGKMLKAHRVSWELHRGDVPSGMFVCHSCDTPACVRPDHLFIGTAAANSADMVAKGRESHAPRAIGAKNGAAKITADVARKVRDLVGSGLSHRKTGKQLGISASQVANIAHRRHWRDA